MAEYEVTGVRYQMSDDMTLEERTQAAEEFIRLYRMASHLVSRREQYDVYAAVLLLEKYGNKQFSFVLPEGFGGEKVH